MDVHEALARHGGAAATRTLRGERVSKDALRKAVADRTVMRVCRGCYALPDAAPARVAAVAWRGVVTCVSALAEAELPVPSHDVVHLGISADRSFSGRNARPPAHVHPHYFEREVPSGVVGALGVASRCLSEEEHLIAVDAALRTGMIARADVESLPECSKRRRRFLARFCDGGAGSPAETLARLAIMRAGIRPRCQVWIRNVGTVDMLIDGWLIVEIDGRRYHADDEAFANDRRRDRGAQLGHLMVLRYPAAVAVYRPDRIVAEVKAALSHGPFVDRRASPLVGDRPRAESP